MSEEMLKIETTAITYKGASGGGLFDASGNCLGMVYAYRMFPEGIGIAITAIELWRFADENGFSDAFIMVETGVDEILKEEDGDK